MWGQHAIGYASPVAVNHYGSVESVDPIQATLIHRDLIY